jgi:hypothetical protein
MKELGSQDIDWIEMTQSREKLDKAFFNYAKWEYTKKNYLNYIDLNNDITIASVLCIIYQSILKQRKRVENAKELAFSRTKLYKYVRNAMQEVNNVNIKEIYKGKTFSELVDILFNFIVIKQYDANNTVEEVMLGAEGQKLNLQIHVIDENDDFDKIRKDAEQDVYNWLIDEMHKTDDGMYL